MDEAIPTRDAINIYDTLDERCAVDNFLGKDRQAAEAMFRENFVRYQEDLMWMGPRAFCYYLPAALAYAMSDESALSSIELELLLNTIEFQLQNEEEAIAPLFPAFREGIGAVVAWFERFGDDPIELDRWMALRLRVGGSG
jgi:hypothetical protein